MPRWTWAAASCRGTAHIQSAEARQDACRILAGDDGWLVAIACDGAGSAICGRLGATIAARTLTTLARDWIAENGVIPLPETIEAWVDHARGRVADVAGRYGIEPGDFATTVAMAMSNGRSIATAHIGDGAIVARLNGSSSWDALSWPANGDYASVTYFLTDPVPQLRIGLMHDIGLDRLALFTDGLERLALNFKAGTAHAPFFDGMFGPLAKDDADGRDERLCRQLTAFLDSEAVGARTDDDKTLILAIVR